MWSEMFDLFVSSFWETLVMVGISGVIGAVVGVPLGVLVTRFRWLSGLVLGLATVVLTIPSIALFGLMIPALSVYGMGIGPAPAVAAVFLYSLLPIMRNTSLALRQIEPSIREAGIGIGMTFWQRLRLVELPLAVPVVLGGVRTAAEILNYLGGVHEESVIEAVRNYDSDLAAKIVEEMLDRKSTRLNSSHERLSRMPSSA